MLISSFSQSLLHKWWGKSLCCAVSWAGVFRAKGRKPSLGKSWLFLASGTRVHPYACPRASFSIFNFIRSPAENKFLSYTLSSYKHLLHCDQGIPGPKLCLCSWSEQVEPSWGIQWLERDVCSWIGVRAHSKFSLAIFCSGHFEKESCVKGAVAHVRGMRMGYSWKNLVSKRECIPFFHFHLPHGGKEEQRREDWG